MEDKKEYELRQVLESLISAYYENERKLIELNGYTYIHAKNVEESYYYISKYGERMPELMFRLIKRKNFLEKTIEKILEMLKLNFPKNQSILCTTNNNGEYVLELEDGMPQNGIIASKNSEFRNMASAILTSDFANKMYRGSIVIPEIKCDIEICPSFFEMCMLCSDVSYKYLLIRYQSHNSVLEFIPSGLTVDEVDAIIFDSKIDSKYFNEYQKEIIEGETNPAATILINKTLDETYKRIRSKN